jgi:hypothetical protein
MATFSKINDFVLHLNEGAHAVQTDNLRLALSVTLPSAETSDPSADGNGLLANVTQIAYTNLSGDPTSRDLALDASSQTAGVYTLSLDDTTLSASGGAVAAFRYLYIYNEDGAVLVDALIGYYDYGSNLTLNDGESLTIDFGADGPTTGALYTMT